VRPGSKDKRHYILITGQELVELKNYTWAMAEAYGLDVRINSYKGKKPIGLWPWDLDCLEAVLDGVLKDYPDQESQEYKAMHSLIGRMHELRQQAYE